MKGCEVGWATPKGFEKDNLLKIYTDNGLYNKLIVVDDMASENAAQSIAEACKRENWIPDGVLVSLSVARISKAWIVDLTQPHGMLATLA
jgi:hypothetical protein